MNTVIPRTRDERIARFADSSGRAIRPRPPERNRLRPCSIAMCFVWTRRKRPTARRSTGLAAGVTASVPTPKGIQIIRGSERAGQLDAVWLKNDVKMMARRAQILGRDIPTHSFDHHGSSEVIHFADPESNGLEIRRGPPSAGAAVERCWRARCRQSRE